jgi:hypothetical protein
MIDLQLSFIVDKFTDKFASQNTQILKNFYIFEDNIFCAK